MKLMLPKHDTSPVAKLEKFAVEGQGMKAEQRMT